MLKRRQPQFAAVFLAVASCAVVWAPAANAGTSSKPGDVTSGSIAGIVRDASGAARAGAAIVLLDRYERVIAEGTTNSKGIFGFPDLRPEVYAVRVSLSKFVPALKRKIAVEAGLQSMLFVNMASLVSSIELVYAAPGQGALISDDWKWTLKSSMATRPVLRLNDEKVKRAAAENGRGENPIFSNTLGMIRISGGDSDGAALSGIQPDLGTAFALATSLYGRNRFQFSGLLGYASRAGMPGGGFRTTFSRSGTSPEISITLRQIYFPAARWATVSGQQDAPALRTMTVSLRDHLDVLDHLRLEYGAEMDSISLLGRVNYTSPYARATYDMRKLGSVQAAFSAGAPPDGLFASQPEGEMQLHQGLAALSAAPVVSLRNGQARVQRVQNFEIGYQKQFGSRRVSVSAFRESVSNGAVITSASAGMLPMTDLLPDTTSSSSVFNIGSYRRFGYATSFNQALGDNVEIGVGYGSAGVLSPDGRGPAGNPDTANPSEALRSHFRTSNRHWASARIAAKLPVTGTEISASYEWTDPGAILLRHTSMTQEAFPQPGCNLRVRQPLPPMFGMPGRLEATAELQNVLAQGYVSLPAGQQRVVLTQVPRAIRGGLSFVF